MNLVTVEGLSKCCGGLGFPFRGLRGERGEEDAGEKNSGKKRRKVKVRVGIRFRDLGI